MTIEIFQNRSPRKYGAGLGLNLQPLDQQSDLLPIVLQSLAVFRIPAITYILVEQYENNFQ